MKTNPAKAINGMVMNPNSFTQMSEQGTAASQKAPDPPNHSCCPP